MGAADPCMEPFRVLAKHCKAGSRGASVLLPGEDKKKGGERNQSAKLFPGFCVASLMAAIFGIWAVFCSHLEILEMFRLSLGKAWGWGVGGKEQVKHISSKEMLK